MKRNVRLGFKQQRKGKNPMSKGVAQKKAKLQNKTYFQAKVGYIKYIPYQVKGGWEIWVQRQVVPTGKSGKGALKRVPKTKLSKPPKYKK
jgi:hypothetical protein|tara:strand:- start:1203 stop:1472 length:270 start_codon:yes stop_codon:yes gene_type:complete